MSRSIVIWFLFSIIVFVLLYLSQIHILSISPILKIGLTAVSGVGLVSTIIIFVYIIESKREKTFLYSLILLLAGAFLYASTFSIGLSSVGYAPCSVKHFACSRVGSYYRCDITLTCGNRTLIIHENVSDISEINNIQCFQMGEEVYCTIG